MTIVIDASVALKWVLPENGSGEAIALRSQSLAAPSHWLIEAGNALWRYVQTNRLPAADAALSLRELAAAPVTSVAGEEILSQAFEIATRLQHPLYDCLYLALAVREDCYVVTADRRFLLACSKDKSLKPRVRLLDGL